MFVEHLGTGSALYRSVLGNSYVAGDVLANAQLNVMRTISWQLSGGKKRDRPDPFWLPGMIPPGDQGGLKHVEHFKGDTMTIEDMDAWLGWDAGRPE